MLYVLFIRKSLCFPYVSQIDQQCWLSLTPWLCMVLKSDDRVPTELKKAIMQARGEKKLTQSQLAHVLSFFSVSFSFFYCLSSVIEFIVWVLILQLINEKPQVIQEYESGKAIPNQQILSKLERALGAKLRGKKQKCRTKLLKVTTKADRSFSPVHMLYHILKTISMYGLV